MDLSYEKELYSINTNIDLLRGNFILINSLKLRDLIIGLQLNFNTHFYDNRNFNCSGLKIGFEYDKLNTELLFDIYQKSLLTMICIPLSKSLFINIRDLITLDNNNLIFGATIRSKQVESNIFYNFVNNNFIVNNKIKLTQSLTVNTDFSFNPSENIQIGFECII